MAKPQESNTGTTSETQDLTPPDDTTIAGPDPVTKDSGWDDDDGLVTDLSEVEEGTPIEAEPYGAVRHEAIKHPDEHNIAHRGAPNANTPTALDDATMKRLNTGKGAVRVRALRTEQYNIGQLRGGVQAGRLYKMPADVARVLWESGVVGSEDSKVSTIR